MYLPYIAIFILLTTSNKTFNSFLAKIYQSWSFNRIKYFQTISTNLNSILVKNLSIYLVTNLPDISVQQ